MSETASQRPSPAVSALDRLVGHLEGVRARAANAFATEMFFFAEVADLVEQRERERAARAGDGATVETTQLGMREVYAEIATALNLSERQVASKVNSAYVMLNMFEETLYCVSEGRLSPTHAQLIADAGQVLEDPTVRSEYERLALNMADELTPAQLRAALPGVVTRLAPELAQDRIREAIARRRVTLRELEPGLSRITADVEALQGAGILSRLSEISTELEAENKAAAEEATATPEAAADEFVADERTRSQIMADVFCDLLLTSAVNGHGVDADDAKRLSTIQATVHVTIPASTLAGTTLGGAALVGGNAIDDDTAKQVVSSADVWVRLFTDPASGVPLTVDRYRPSSLQRLFLAARDEQCRFPGCRRPARKCDIDPYESSRRRRTHLALQSRAPLRTTSHSETSVGLGSHTAPGRCAPVGRADTTHPYDTASCRGPVRSRTRPATRSVLSTVPPVEPTRRLVQQHTDQAAGPAA